LPIELLTDEERSAFVDGTLLFQNRLMLVGVLCAAFFFLIAWLYHAISCRQSGQTFGMRAISIHVARPDGAPLSFGRSLWRGALHALFVVLLDGAVVLFGNLTVSLFDSVDTLTPETVASLLLFWVASLVILLLGLLSLIPRRSLSDWLAGTTLFSLSGDLFEAEQARADQAAELSPPVLA
jgi:uncharacterized RDD family membrane protein YckC